MNSLFIIAKLLTPYWLRRTNNLAWLKVFLSYAQMLVYKFELSTKQARILGHMTPQVCYIEKHLQTKYADNTIAIIDIEEAVNFVYFTSELEISETFLDDSGTTFYLSLEYEGCGFAVQCSLLAFNSFGQSIAQTVSKYKLPGIKFLFQVL